MRTYNYKKDRDESAAECVAFERWELESALRDEPGAFNALCKRHE